MYSLGFAKIGAGIVSLDESLISIMVLGNGGRDCVGITHEIYKRLNYKYPLVAASPGGAINHLFPYRY